jgi:hypothetical protein
MTDRARGASACGRSTTRRSATRHGSEPIDGVLEVLALLIAQPEGVAEEFDSVAVRALLDPSLQIGDGTGAQTRTFSQCLLGQAGSPPMPAELDREGRALVATVHTTIRGALFAPLLFLLHLQSESIIPPT